MRRRFTRLALFPWSFKALLPLLVAVIFILVSLQCCLFWFDSSKHDIKKENVKEIHRGYTKAKISVQPQLALPSCSVPKFRNGSSDDYSVECKRAAPTGSSCEMAKRIYSNVETAECGEHKELCTLKFEGDATTFRCDPALCRGQVRLGMISPTRGELIWDQFETSKAMEDKFQQLLLEKDPSLAAGMAFIVCNVEEVPAEEEDGNIVRSETSFLNLYDDEEFVIYEEASNAENSPSRQLLIFPNITKDIHKSSRTDNKLNVNIVFLDSVSHSHFFRVLPLTVEQLRKMDKSGSNLVFNFELMQSLKSRTFENEQALFSGLTTGKEETLMVEVMFGRYKRHGYNITWNEDLCWMWEWGFSRNFGIHETPLKDRWKRVREVMQKHQIDDIGATLASCEILRFNGKNDPFHGLKKVCYNGRFQHWYIFEYMKQVQSIYHQANIPYLQFTELNVGHDEHGIRIKTLDQDLKEYLEYISSLENTLTILFSDHGNTYTKFASGTDEGRMEMFHPMLFLIAPNNFERFVGKRGVRRLGINQHRLVSLLDVHFMLMSIINEAHPNSKQILSVHDGIPQRGLLDVISSRRTCHSLPLFPNTKCICKTKTQNKTYHHSSSHILLADFALGQLNNELSVQYHKAYPNSTWAFGSCQKLEGISIENVDEMPGKHNISQVELTIATKAGWPFTDQHEIFTVTVDIPRHNDTTFNMSGYERISRFNKYEECADAGVEKKLCVCNLKSNDSSSWHRTVSPAYYPLVFNQSSLPQRVTRCLTVLERRLQSGLILDGLNTCNDTYLHGEISLAGSKNVVSSTKLPANFTLYPNQNLFLIAFLALVETEQWNAKYKIIILTR